MHPAIEKSMADIEWNINHRETAKLALGKSIPAFVVEHLFIAGATYFKNEQERLDEEERWEKTWQVEKYQKQVDAALMMLIFYLCTLLVGNIFIMEVINIWETAALLW